jgi:hypothetical protein
VGNPIDVHEARELLDRVERQLEAELAALAANDFVVDTRRGRLRRSTVRLKVQLARLHLMGLDDGMLSRYDELWLRRTLVELRRLYPTPEWREFLEQHPELG